MEEECSGLGRMGVRRWNKGGCGTLVVVVLLSAAGVERRWRKSNELYMANGLGLVGGGSALPLVDEPKVP